MSFSCTTQTLVVTAILALTSPLNAALMVQGYDVNRHDRSDSNSFIGSGYSFSGVANSGLNAQNNLEFRGWATMISPSFFLSANHFHNADGVNLRFFETNSVMGTYVDRMVLSGQRIAGSDLWLGRLDSPLTTVSIYSIATGNLVGQPIQVVGRSATSPAQRVGSNVIDEQINSFSHPNLGSSVGDVYAFDLDPVTDEARVEGGDSGGPSFAIVNGSLALAGIHWFQYTVSDDPSTPENEALQPPGSGDTRAGNYMTQINSAIAAANIGESASFVPVAVPEPGTWTLLAVTVVGLSVRRFCCSWTRQDSVCLNPGGSSYGKHRPLCP